jgi:hypothetical protein
MEYEWRETFPQKKRMERDGSVLFALKSCRIYGKTIYLWKILYYQRP